MQYDDFEDEEETKPEVKYCQCGSKVSFGCGDQCRVCFYSANFLAKPIESHLRAAGTPRRIARVASKHYPDAFLKEGMPLYPSFSDSFENSVFLHGLPGSGKTVFATAMMIHHMLQWNTTKEHFKKGRTFLFESMPNMIQNLRHAIRGSVEDEITTIDRYKNVDFLILDDFGVEKSSDWAFSILYLIISHRYEEDKQTIFTSNFDLDQLAEKNNDERLTRRISDWCKIIHLTR